MRRIAKLILLLVVCVAPARGASYYISYSSGSNSNNGTSEMTPWKSHPYMSSASGCAGSPHAYTHSAGDVFTFKQGDSYPNVCFPFTFVAGGSSGNPDIYTYDPTWGTAGGTTGNAGQSVGTYQFNAGSAVIGSGSICNNFLDFQTNSVSNVIFNGAELVNYLYSTSSSCVHGTSENHMMENYQSTGNTLENLYIHGWSHGSSTSDSMCVLCGYNTGGTSAGTCLVGSVIDGASDSGTSGEAVFATPCAHDDIVRNMSNGILPNEPALVYNNKIGPINTSFDASDHSNCIETLGPYSGSGTSYIYNNYCAAGSEALVILGGNDTSGPAIYYAWNNVLDMGASSAHPNVPIILMGTATAVHGWNNTIVANPSGDACVENQGTYGTIDWTNNFCIDSKGSFDQNGVSYPNNTLMTNSAATSVGLSASQTFAYQPTSSNCGGASQCPVGAGSNLTSSATGPLVSLARDTTYGGVRSTNARPNSGSWDDGAYEFTTGPTPNPPTGVEVILLQ